MTKYLVYTHPAVMPANVKLGIWYSLEELQERFTIEDIKCFFHPCNFAWEEIEVTPEVKTTKK